MTAHRIAARPIARALIAVALLAGLAACGTGPAEGVRVTLVGEPRLNPARNGTANPVQVRIYLLNSPDTFRGADYFQLFDKEAATLGADLALRDEQIIRPGETKEITLIPRPGARYLGVAAAYRAIDGATWRAVVPVAAKVQITLSANAVTVR